MPQQPEPASAVGHVSPSRRDLMKLGGVAVAGRLLLGLRLTGRAQAAEPLRVPGGDFAPNAFIVIAGGGAITLIMPHTEVGQGIYTSSAMLIAEELEVGLDQIAVQPAPPDLKKYLDPHLFDQATGGSMSTRSDWRRLREAGAAARLMLVAVAAQRWAVDPSECRVERGTVHHDPSGRALGS